MSEWEYTLYTGGLFERFAREDIVYPRILISAQLPGGGKRKFRLFESFEDFEKFYNGTNKKKRHFYEVIFGEMKQKPHFDIDKIKSDDPDTLERISKRVIDEITRCFESIGIKEKELYWYGSHTEKVRSYHLVIPRYYVENNNEAMRLWHFLQENVQEDVAQYIDSSVYSSLQNFRILGCCKIPKEGEKRRYKRLLFREKSEKDLKKSLLTQITDKMKPFPPFETNFNQSDNRTAMNAMIDGDLMREANKYVLEYLGDNFSLYESKCSFLSYKRNQPSFCNICQVVHESIYPFAVVKPQGRIFLHCHRSREYCKGEEPRRIEIYNPDAPPPEWIGSTDFLMDPTPVEKLFVIDYNEMPAVEKKKEKKKNLYDISIFQETRAIDPKSENLKMLSSKGKLPKSKT